MLTPVDIQQKKFRIGLGYEKKDVNDFFDEVLKDFEALYRSNAELKEEVALLDDNLQHYKSREKELEKNKLLAEKDSEDTKSRATQEAKNIELDAKNRAKVILKDAEARLEQIKGEVAELESRYAMYKSEFALLLKKQFYFLGETDFDVSSKIDERYMSMAGKTGGGNSSSNSSSSDFGTYEGDPQMRDQSTLGGMGGGASGSYGSTSDSSVYTSGLGANDNFVDPFNPSSNNRFNPFGDMSEGQSGGSGSKDRVKRTGAKSDGDVPPIS